MYENIAQHSITKDEFIEWLNQRAWDRANEEVEEISRWAMKIGLESVDPQVDSEEELEVRSRASSADREGWVTGSDLFDLTGDSN